MLLSDEQDEDLLSRIKDLNKLVDETKNQLDEANLSSKSLE